MDFKTLHSFVEKLVSRYQQQINDDALYDILGSCEISEKQFSRERNTFFFSPNYHQIIGTVISLQNP